MKALFDTSVLVATFLADHEFHARSLDAFLRFKPSEAGCAAHSLAELYASLTRLPGKHRVSPEHAVLFLEQARARLTLVALDAEEYYQALQDASTRGIVGGTIYDALVVRCAVKGKADVLYTWNVKHFELIAGEMGRRIRVP